MAEWLVVLKTDIYHIQAENAEMGPDGDLELTGASGGAVALFAAGGWVSCVRFSEKHGEYGEPANG